MQHKGNQFCLVFSYSWSVDGLRNTACLLGTQWAQEMPVSSVTADCALHLDQAIMQIYGAFAGHNYPVSTSEGIGT